jgi:hypothetical protein
MNHNPTPHNRSTVYGMAMLAIEWLVNNDETVAELSASISLVRVHAGIYHVMLGDMHIGTIKGI